MADPKRGWGERLKLAGDVLLKIIKGRAGWGYVSLARVGLGVVGLGISALIPGFWETILDWLLPKLGVVSSDLEVEVAFEDQTLIASFVIVAGLLLIFLSFWFYHRHVLRAGPSTEKDGSVNTRIQARTPMRNLLDYGGEVTDSVIDYSGLPEEALEAFLLEGPLKASSVEDFLRQVGVRARPPIKMGWDRDANVYQLRTD